MTINVTPIPRLIDLAAPAFTLGTANAAGSAATAVASDSTLLAFDAVAPAAAAAAAVVGTSTVTARRDHVHPGTTGAGTVVDEAITRFNGTGGSSLQGYSSLSPTISDAGIVSLTSGALKFPATEITSADANTLDDYQQGSWTPDLQFGGNKVSITYGYNNATYVKIGNHVFFEMWVRLTSKGSSTGDAEWYGLPYTVGAVQSTSSISWMSVISFADFPSAIVFASGTVIGMFESTNAGTSTTLTDSNFSNTSNIVMSGSYAV